MDLGLKDKKVQVTAGARGIDLACAELFLAEVTDITTVGRDPRSAAAALNRCDLRHPGALRGHGDRPRLRVGHRSAGRILGYGRCGGQQRWSHPWGPPGGGARRHVKAGPGSRDGRLPASLPAMLDRGHGGAVNVTGSAGPAPRHDSDICGSMAKAALIAFPRTAKARSTSRGVRVLGLNHGPSEAELLRVLFKVRPLERLGDEKRRMEASPHLPFGRLVRPQEMADLAIFFLVSAGGSYLSGVVIDVDGRGIYATP